MVIDISKKVNIAIKAFIIMFCMIFLLGIGWFSYEYLHKKEELNQCLVQLKKTQVVTQNYMSLIQRSDHLMDSMKIHIHTCQTG